MIKILKSQVMLELSMVFFIFCLFILGIIGIWVWSNAQIVGRQSNYKETRLASGSSNPGQWPVYTPSTLPEDYVILKE